MDAVLLAAGSGARMGASENKIFIKLCGREMVLYTLDAFQNCAAIDRIIIVAAESDLERIGSLSALYTKVNRIVCGGETRQQSSFIGIREAESEYVLIHDAARALVTEEDIIKVADAALSCGGATVASPCFDTVKRANGDYLVTETIDRNMLFKIYTPQAFKTADLIRLHTKAANHNNLVTDDCALYELGGLPVKIVCGKSENIKLTVREDLEYAEMVLKKRSGNL